MLIYNYKKEFLGIDEDDLKSLGLSNLADLRAEAADFADLFVKTPGFIHNFKHVHWIDYITCNDSGVESKAVIHIRNKNYTAAIDIQTIYLVDNPSKKAYIVNLSNIRPLSGTQTEKISNALLNKAKPQTTTESTELLTVPGSVVHNEKNASAYEDIGELSYDPYDSDYQEISSNKVQHTSEDEISKIDLSLDEPFEMAQEIPPLEEEFHKEVKKTVEVEESGPYSNYMFDPHVASDELGLPIDLVEEFIQDFIAQAIGFKDELYESAKIADLNNLKIQSHKLKGVAANLRVEDALDALTIINNSDNDGEIKKNLDRLYRIIEKLSKKGNTPAKSDNNSQKIEEKVEEEFVLSLKDDEPKVKELNLEKEISKEISENVAQIKNIDDSDVPDSIEILELLDDDFLKPESSISENEIEDLSILENDIDMSQETSQEKDIAPSYDKELIAKDFGLDIESFNELFQDYMNESRDLTDAIQNAIKSHNLSLCKSSAIKLKGMSDNMRIHRFDDELDAIINSKDTNSVNDLLDSIASKLNQISHKEDR